MISFNQYQKGLDKFKSKQSLNESVNIKNTITEYNKVLLESNFEMINEADDVNPIEKQLARIPLKVKIAKFGKAFYTQYLNKFDMAGLIKDGKGDDEKDSKKYEKQKAAIEAKQKSIDDKVKLLEDDITQNAKKTNNEKWASDKKADVKLQVMDKVAKNVNKLFNKSDQAEFNDSQENLKDQVAKAEEEDNNVGTYPNDPAAIKDYKDTLEKKGTKYKDLKLLDKDSEKPGENYYEVGTAKIGEKDNTVEKTFWLEAEIEETLEDKIATAEAEGYTREEPTEKDKSNWTSKKISADGDEVTMWKKN